MKLWEEDFVGEMCYLVISFPIWPLSDQSSLDKPVVGESWSDANFCLSYLLTMVYLRYTRSGHLDIVAISWRAHSNSLIFATFFCHIPTYFISHTNAHTVSRVYFSLCPCFLAAAQYSSQGSGSETLRVSLRVSGSGSEGRVRAKHHNTRDNGGFMPFASYGRRPDGETDKERETVFRTSSPQFVRFCVGWLYSHCEPLVSLLPLFSVSLYCHFVCPGLVHAASRSQTWLGCKCGNWEENIIASIVTIMGYCLTITISRSTLASWIFDTRHAYSLAFFLASWGAQGVAISVRPSLP